MFARIAEWSIKNRFLVLLFAVLLVGWGTFATLRTPVDAIPDLSENQVIVWADWMGRSPKEVEDQVTYPLSVNLQGLAGVRAIRATSELGFSMINVIFRDDVEFYFARQRILENLSVAQAYLPPGVVPYMAPDATAVGQVFWYTVEGDAESLERLRAIQEFYVRYQLQSVEGVSQVANVGGLAREYQVDVDPEKLRAYGIALGQVFHAVMRSNSSVGGRVVHHGGEEWLVRGVGWIRSPDDIAAIPLAERGGVPVYVRDVATVQLGPQFRRGVLEKNGSEAVGGVVLIRYGANPLEITERVKAKIRELTPGLPPGVRIVPFYDRTGLIHDAIHTLTGTLTEEIIVASLAVLVILMHLRSAFVICCTLPLAALVAFIFMYHLGIPSNIMSLSGIAISIGVLIDAGIVMTENAYHRLQRKFGDRPVTGDTRDEVIASCRVVTGPLVFSILIMLVTFLPVFALSGMEGRMFHPLAYTKSFALVGVLVLALTVVPALIPTFVRGRLRHEERNWLVASVISIYRPVLTWLFRHPNVVVLSMAGLLVFAMGFVNASVFFYGLVSTETLFRATLFLVLVLAVIFTEEPERRPSVVGMGVGLPVFSVLGGVAAVSAALLAHVRPDLALARDVCLGTAIFCVPLAFRLIPYLPRRVTVFVTIVALGLWSDGFRRIGGEFMPPLDEGSILDMPITTPNASITQAADDLRARDALLRLWPEVHQVVGKAGRVETPTDPAPVDMVETVVGLYPRAWWPRRKLPYDDATAATAAMLADLERDGLVQAAPDGRGDLVNNATMDVATAWDVDARALVLRRRDEGAPERRRALVAAVAEPLIEALRRTKRLTAPVALADLQPAIARSADIQGRFLDEAPAAREVDEVSAAVVTALRAQAALSVEGDPLVDLRAAGLWQRALDVVRESVGAGEASLTGDLLAAVEARRDALAREAARQVSWELEDRVPGVVAEAALSALLRHAAAQKLVAREPGPAESEAVLAAARERLHGTFLWRKLKDDLVKEMDSEIQVPGWGNIWTQPIINRVDMLATGVRTAIGVKIFGSDLVTLQRLANETSDVLKQVRGAVDVFPDQIVGENYLEIHVDRHRAARYGLTVDDVQDVVEVALGGKTITMTVEGRERFPVRVRFPRDWRDLDRVGRILVPTRLSAGGGDDGMAGMGGPAAPTAGDGLAPPLPGPAQVPLSQVADVRLVEGPSMIKSENGLLRVYVQLNVRDRDILSFVEEAQRAVATAINPKLPPGYAIEWSGQFEHQMRAARTLRVVFPTVLVLIAIMLYLTFRDWSHTAIHLLTVPGALAGGILFQKLFGFNFSVAVWVGYIACFGLATETAIVMLTYLREALLERGDLEGIGTEAGIAEAVIAGAVHRLRPKLLTEGTTIIGLCPMLWATGTGAEIMAPMAAPVLGGILVADEVIDVFIPVIFYKIHCRRLRRLRARRAAEAARLRAPAPAGGEPGATP